MDPALNKEKNGKGKLMEQQVEHVLIRHILLQLYSGLKCRYQAEKMMEESGIETTPPTTPTPPLTAATPVSAPPMTIGKRAAVRVDHLPL